MAAKRGRIFEVRKKKKSTVPQADAGEMALHTYKDRQVFSRHPQLGRGHVFRGKKMIGYCLPRTTPLKCPWFLAVPGGSDCVMARARFFVSGGRRNAEWLIDGELSKRFAGSKGQSRKQAWTG